MVSSFNRNAALTCFRTVQTCPLYIYLFISTHLSCIYRGCMFLIDAKWHQMSFLCFLYVHKQIEGVGCEKDGSHHSFVKVDIYWTDLHVQRINKIAILGTQNDFKFTFITSGHFWAWLFSARVCAVELCHHNQTTFLWGIHGALRRNHRTGLEDKVTENTLEGVKVCRETSKCPPYPTPRHLRVRAIHCAGQ